MTVAIDDRPPEATPAPDRPRILIIAYACQPGRGSEPGAGWGISRALAEVGSCTVLVADEFMPALQAWQDANPKMDAEFVSVRERPISRYMAFHRVPRFLRYLLWLRDAGKEARRRHEERPFDAAVHASYGTYWLPSPAVGLGIPSVWGPVGGAVASPVRLWPSLGFLGSLGEILDLASVRLLALVPATRRTMHQATIPVVMNIETLEALPDDVQLRSRIINNAPFVDLQLAAPRAREPYVVFPSALEPRKGPRLALKAFARVRADLKLVFAADGMERPALEKMAHRLGVADRVVFCGQIAREEMFEYLAGATAAVYTGLREEGGVALVEGMLHGAPTVLLGHGGVVPIAEAAIDPSRIRIVKPGSMSETAQRVADAIDAFAANPPSGTGPNLDQTKHRRLFQRAVFDAIDTARAPAIASRFAARVDA